MKEVGTFKGCICLFFFWPKMVYHRDFFCTGCSVLCICIYKQIYPNNICRLQSASSVKGSNHHLHHSTASNLYICKVTKIWKTKTKKLTEAYLDMISVSPSYGASDWTAERCRCDIIGCYRLDFVLAAFVSQNKLLAARGRRSQTVMTSHAIPRLFSTNRGSALSPAASVW